MRSFEAGNSPKPIFFYCSRNRAEPTRSDPRAILASLARQLSTPELGRSILKPTVDLYTKEEAEGFASGPLQIDESCQLIIQLAEVCTHTIIIIDAIDECDPKTRLELLQSLEHMLQKSSSLLKIFVSSRDDQDVVLRLTDYPNLEIDSKRNSKDITLFVRDDTERLIREKRLLCYSSAQKEMKELIVDKVIKGADGM